MLIFLAKLMGHKGYFGRSPEIGIIYSPSANSKSAPKIVFRGNFHPVGLNGRIVTTETNANLGLNPVGLTFGHSCSTNPLGCHVTKQFDSTCATLLFFLL